MDKLMVIKRNGEVVEFDQMRVFHAIKKAVLSDVREIQALVNAQASRNRMLPRSLHDLYDSLRDFQVARLGRKLAGTCALHITWEDLGEIRSLAVEEEHRNQGIGRTLVRRCLSEAKRLGIRRVFSLTYCPEFFTRLGFTPIDKAELPHKVWAECIRCHHFPDCKEEALVREF